MGQVFCGCLLYTSRQVRRNVDKAAGGTQRALNVEGVGGRIRIHDREFPIQIDRSGVDRHRGKIVRQHGSAGSERRAECPAIVVGYRHGDCEAASRAVCVAVDDIEAAVGIRRHGDIGIGCSIAPCDGGSELDVYKRQNQEWREARHFAH